MKAKFDCSSDPHMPNDGFRCISTLTDITETLLISINHDEFEDYKV